MEKTEPFSITLPSKTENGNSSIKNSSGHFYVKLNPSLKLVGDNWKVALTKISYRRSWINIDQKAVVTIFHLQEKGFRSADFTTIGNALVGDAMKKLEDTIGLQVLETKAIMPTGLTLYPGFYPTPGTIAATIYKDFRHLRTVASHELFPMYFDYEPNGKIVSLHGPLGILFTEGKDYMKAMNLSGGTKLDDNNDLFFSKLWGSDGKVPNTTDTILVYSDLVRYNAIGNTTVPLLATVPVSGEHNTTVCYEPLRPEYKEVYDNDLLTVEIQLNNTSGEEIKFQDGEVIVVL
ncbi:MAG: hypothetical protein FD143_3519, partial [Ignavibacteria bacterium]